MIRSSLKHKRDNITLLHKSPEKFGRFVMALRNLIDSDDWMRICGIHGNTFKPNDSAVKCPTDQAVVEKINETGEPFYCKHKVYTFIAWHTPYVYQFELLLNKYNKSKDQTYLPLPYIDLTDFTQDFSFMNTPKISIFYDKKKVTIDNPLASAYYYKDGVKTPTTREGFLRPTTKKQRMQLNTVRRQLNNALYAINYEQFSSSPVTHSPSNIVVNYVPLETPHNTLHDVIGGDNGNMGSVTISAFDPIFWLHHCNMDRHYYTWMHNNTNSFKNSIYPDLITEMTYEATGAPFSKGYLYSDDFRRYGYGWENGSNEYLQIKDVLNLEKFPYTYDIIKPTPKKDTQSFIELMDIPIPYQSTDISVYIHLKTEALNKEEHFAGSSFWFGVNRGETKCKRCNVTRTNIKIELDDYVAERHITQANVNDYEIVLEGTGRNTRAKYSLIDLIKDGTYRLYISSTLI